MTPHADLRRTQLQEWLKPLAGEFGLDIASLRPASSDASFRRYFRIDAAASTLVVMDAPPPHEDCGPFVEIAQRLLNAGLNVPRVLAQNQELGFLLLSDLGPHTYYDALQHAPTAEDVREWYRNAIQTLIRLQQVSIQGLPVYDAERLRSELDLFPDWYIGVHCKAALTDRERTQLERIFALLVARNSKQPYVFVHRDYHSPNLLLPLPDRLDAPGIIDFQDALSGPITYDLASLIMDARTTWEEPQQLDWGIRYWEAARKAGLPVSHDIAEFHADWEWMGLQRNLRILGVFARLHHRDGKDHYLQHIPRVMDYVRQVASHYDVFTPLLRLLDRLHVEPDASASPATGDR